MKKSREAWTIAILGLLCFITIWELVARWLGPTKLPSPLTIFSGLVSTFNYSLRISIQGGGEGGFKPHIFYTAQRTLTGSFAGIVMGIGVGLAMGWSRRLRMAIELPLEAIRTIPPLVLIPFFLMWFGRGPRAQFSILALYCFFMLTINTLEAINNVRPSRLNFALTLGASRGQVFRTVVLPSIVPELTGGIRVAIGTSWGIQVVAELMGTPWGIGKVFELSRALQALDLIIIGIMWITILAVITDLTFLSLARYITRWAPRVS